MFFHQTSGACSNFNEDGICAYPNKCGNHEIDDTSSFASTVARDVNNNIVTNYMNIRTAESDLQSLNEVLKRVCIVSRTPFIDELRLCRLGNHKIGARFTIYYYNMLKENPYQVPITKKFGKQGIKTLGLEISTLYCQQPSYGEF